jgi:hypothetical protein
MKKIYAYSTLRKKCKSSQKQELLDILTSYSKDGNNKDCFMKEEVERGRATIAMITQLLEFQRHDVIMDFLIKRRSDINKEETSFMDDQEKLVILRAINARNPQFLKDWKAGSPSYEMKTNKNDRSMIATAIGNGDLDTLKAVYSESDSLKEDIIYIKQKVVGYNEAKDRMLPITKDFNMKTSLLAIAFAQQDADILRWAIKEAAPSKEDLVRILDHEIENPSCAHPVFSNLFSKSKGNDKKLIEYKAVIKLKELWINILNADVVLKKQDPEVGLGDMAQANQSNRRGVSEKNHMEASKASDTGNKIFDGYDKWIYGDWVVIRDSYTKNMYKDDRWWSSWKSSGLLDEFQKTNEGQQIDFKKLTDIGSPGYMYKALASKEDKDIISKEILARCLGLITKKGVLKKNIEAFFTNKREKEIWLDHDLDGFDPKKIIVKNDVSWYSDEKRIINKTVPAYTYVVLNHWNSKSYWASGLNKKDYVDLFWESLKKIHKDDVVKNGMEESRGMMGLKELLPKEFSHYGFKMKMKESFKKLDELAKYSTVDFPAYWEEMLKTSITSKAGGVINCQNLLSIALPLMWAVEKNYIKPSQLMNKMKGLGEYNNRWREETKQWDEWMNNVEHLTLMESATSQKAPDKNNSRRSI